MSFALSTGTAASSMLLNSISELIQKDGASSVATFFKSQSFGVDALEKAVEDNPVEAGAALTTGLVVALLAGPEIAAGEAVAVLGENLLAFAPQFFTATTAEATASAFIDGLLQLGGQSLYQALRATLEITTEQLNGSFSINSDQSLNIILPIQSNISQNLFISPNGDLQSTFYNPAQTDAIIVSQLWNNNGSSVITANNQTINFAAGQTPNLTIDPLGGVRVSFTAPNNVTGSFGLVASGITATVNGFSFSDTLANTQVIVDALGNATFTTPLTGFGSSVISVSTSGTDVFAVGADSLLFAPNTLDSVSYANGTFGYVTAPVVAGYGNSIQWNPTTGMATYDLVSANGTTAAASLGQINPTDKLVDNGTTISDETSTGAIINSDQIQANGTQVDTSVNQGSGNALDTIATINTAGVVIQTDYTNKDGSFVDDDYSQTGSLAGQVIENANGTGSITDGAEAVSLVAGDQISNVTFGSQNDPVVTIDPNAGKAIAETLDISATGIKSVIDGATTTDSQPGTTASMDATGDLTLTTPLGGFGSSVLTESANGTDTSSVGADSVVFAPNQLQNVTMVNGTLVYGLASTVAGDSETAVFNPTTGRTLVELAGSAGNNTVSDGTINPGDKLVDSGSTLIDETSTGAMINSVQVEANGTIVDESVNQGAGNALNTIDTYNNTGVLIEAQYDNRDSSAVTDIYSATTGSETAQVIENSNDTGTLTWASGGSVSFAGTGSGIVITATATPDLFEVSGTGAIIETTAAPVTLDVADNSQVTFTGSNATIVGGANDTLVVNGNSETLSSGAGGNDTLTGSGDRATLSSSTVILGATDSNDIVSGTGDTIDAAPGANIGVTGSNDTVNGTQATITLNAGSTADTVTGSAFTVYGNAGDSYTITGAGGDTINAAAGNVVTVSGNGPTGPDDIINLVDGTTNLANGVHADIYGSGNTVNAATNDQFGIDGGNERVGLQGTDQVWLAGGGDVVTGGAGNTVNVADNGQNGVNDVELLSGATINLSPNARTDVDGTNNTLNLATNDNVGVAQGSDTINGGSNDNIWDDSGNGTVINSSGDNVTLGSNLQVTIDGSHDTVGGAGSDTVNVSGQYDPVTDNSSTIDYSGSDTGDTVAGSGDSGSDWGGSAGSDNSGGDSGGGGDTSGDSGGDDGGDDGGDFAFATMNGKISPTAAASVAAYGKQLTAATATPFEGASWGSQKTITWSFAASNLPTQVTDKFSGYITDPTQQAEVEAAIQAMARASGLNFVEVADSAQADIRIGYASLNTQSTSELGDTIYSYGAHNLLNPGIVVQLEDPAQLPLATSNGQLSYSQTPATLEQTTLHELGHVVGLADNATPGSAMNYMLTAGNQNLSAGDIANLKQLYAATAGQFTTTPNNSVVVASDQVSASLISQALGINNTLSFIRDTGGVTVDLTKGTAIESVTTSGKTILYTDSIGTGYATIIGSPHNDILTASLPGQTLIGGGGQDILVGASKGGTTFQGTAAQMTGTTIQNLQSTDTIDLTGFSNIGLRDFGFAAGSLTGSNGSSAFAINLPGLAANEIFVASSNGFGGTNISGFAPTDPTYSAFLAAHPGYQIG